MEVKLQETLSRAAASGASEMLRQLPRKEENKNCTKTTTSEAEEVDNSDDDSRLLVSLPKAEVKLVKLRNDKLLIDNNENSLSVDTLIEMLSTEPPPPAPAGEKNNVPLPPETSTASSSTLNSPASSSSVKTGASPSPKSTPKNKYPSPFYANGGKPMIADMNKKMKQVSKKQPKAVYQSQISDNAIGIKLCIKKSIDSSNKSTPNNNNNNNNTISKAATRKRSRKSKTTRATKATAAKAALESDSDDPYVKKRKKTSSNNSSSNNNNNNTALDEPIEQSGWGKRLPKEILFDVSCC